MTNTTEQTTGSATRDAIEVYGRYVLEERAVPDSRDGQKPVHRRILWSMHQLGLYPNKGFKKCARIVGECLGLYHPHGDASTYGALCSLQAQRYPLVEGHGNFGNDLGDPPAAMRYTEARLSPLGVYCFEHINIQPMMDNYSGECLEPIMLDAALPYLLLNGSEGIAVGLSSCLPPHNLQEIIKAIRYVLTHPDCDPGDLVGTINGPDYASGGILISTDEDLKSLYRTGSGSLKYRCEYHFEDEPNQLVVTSFAPRFRPETFIAKCKKLADENIISYIADESSGENGIRLVVGFEDAQALQDHVVNLLYTSVPHIFYVVDRDREKLQPELLNLTQLIQRWIDFRRSIEKKVIEQRLEELRVKLMREQTKFTVSENIGGLEGIFFNASSYEEMIRWFTIEPYFFTREQAEYAVELKLVQIASWNKDEIQVQMKSLEKEVTEEKEKLNNIDGVIREALKHLMMYADDRRTKINVPTPELPGSQLQRYVSASVDGSFKVYQSAPTKGRGLGYEYLVYTGTHVTAFTKDNKAQQFYTTYLKEGQSELKDVIALIPSTKKVIVAIDPNGYGIVLANPQKIDEFEVMRDCPEVAFVVGLEEGDRLILTYDETHRIYEGAEIIADGVSRRGSAGYRIKRLRKVDKMYCVPKGGMLIDKEGKDITEKGGEVAYLVAEMNLVVYDDGSKAMLTPPQVIKQLKTIKQIVPLM